MARTVSATQKRDHALTTTTTAAASTLQQRKCSNSATSASKPAKSRANNKKTHAAAAAAAAAAVSEAQNFKAVRSSCHDICKYGSANSGPTNLTKASSRFTDHQSFGRSPKKTPVKAAGSAAASPNSASTRNPARSGNGMSRSASKSFGGSKGTKAEQEVSKTKAKVQYLCRSSSNNGNGRAVLAESEKSGDGESSGGDSAKNGEDAEAFQEDSSLALGFEGESEEKQRSRKRWGECYRPTLAPEGGDGEEESEKKKSGEDWMSDHAIEEAVSKPSQTGTSGGSKVKVLVGMFESVISHSDNTCKCR